MEMLAIGYVVVLLQAAFLGGDHFPMGTVVEVPRGGRNAMIAGGIARDATDEEIAAFRGSTVGEPADDGALSATQAELVTLEAGKKLLVDEVSALEVTKLEISGAVTALTDQKQALTGEVAELVGQKQALADEVAKLEKAKTAAAAKAK